MLLLVVLLIAPVLSYNKHIPYSELLKCKEFQGPADYNYQQFFDIIKFDNNKPSNGEVFRIKLYVLSTRDAWILLSSSANLTEEAHEIGIIYNTAVIQTPYYHFGDKRKIYTSEPDPRVNFHPLYPLEVVITYTYGGRVSVIFPEHSTSKPYVTHLFDTYTPCPYIAFTSGPSKGEARWFYDCPLGDSSVFVI